MGMNQNLIYVLTPDPSARRRACQLVLPDCTRWTQIGAAPGVSPSYSRRTGVSGHIPTPKPYLLPETGSTTGVPPWGWDRT